MSGEELEEILIYQDFITIQLLKQLGWSLNQLASKKYNIDVGESMSGIEIKNDKRMSETGNLYIETEEHHYQSEKFVPSGVNRKDNTILWCIGDDKVAYIMVKKQLKFLCDNYERFGFKKAQTHNSKGILIPLKWLDDHDIYVVKKLLFEENK